VFYSHKVSFNSLQFLDTFKLANQGDEHAQTLLHRYSALIAVKRSKAYWMRLARTELAWQAKLRNRPILTGGFLRPTLFNKPLPRLKPQPLAITFIIAKRRAARERRMEKMAKLQEAMMDLKVERQFEEGLRKLVQGRHVFQAIYSGQCFNEWGTLSVPKAFLHYSHACLRTTDQKRDARYFRDL
jgi:hypothetical protein